MIVEIGPMSRERLLQIAEALDAEGRGVALLDGDGWGATELACDPVEERRVACGPTALDQVATILDELGEGPVAPGWGGLRPAARWMGYVGYEAARSLERPAWTRGRGHDERPGATGDAAVLRRFGAVARRDPRTGVVAVEGDDEATVRRLASTLRRSAAGSSPAPVQLSLRPIDDDEAHAARVREVLALITRGDVYVVNVARTWEGECDAAPTTLLRTMLSRASARFAAALDLGDLALASTSPELFLDVGPPCAPGRRVLTSPIKGTRPRGADAGADLALAAGLRADPKEVAELTMVVDLERNDLGRVAQYGSVRVVGAPHVETSRTVHHLVQDVVARLRPGVGLGAAMAATFPSGSVTGAPKVRAMEVIACLEARRRGPYCGALIRVDRGGALRAAMTIRTVVLNRRSGLAEYHAGGGIVSDSVPIREVEETRWKAVQIVPR